MKFKDEKYYLTLNRAELNKMIKYLTEARSWLHGCTRKKPLYTFTKSTIDYILLKATEESQVNI